MNWRRRLILCALVCGAFSGCNLDVPSVESASYAAYESGVPDRPTPLSSAQIHQFSAWLSSHRWGWSQSVVSHAPTLLVQLKHANGDSSTVNIRPAKLIVYGSFGQYEKSLTEAEYVNIIRLIRPNDGAPKIPSK